MARIFVFMMAGGLALAHIIYGGNPLEAMDKLQRDLLSLLIYLPLFLIPACAIAWILGGKKKSSEITGVELSDGVTISRQAAPAPTRRDLEIEAAADKLLLNAGYNPDALRGRPTRENTVSTGKPLSFDA